MAFALTIAGGAETAQVPIQSVRIVQAAQGNATASFDVIDNGAAEAFAAKDAVVINDGATVYFKGEIAGTPQREEIAPSKVIWHIECQDYNQLLHETVVTAYSQAAAALSDDDLIDDLVTTHRDEADIDSDTNVAEIVAVGDMPAYSVEACSLHAALTELCKVTAGHFYVDFDKALHYYATSTTNAAFGLSDAYDGVTTYRHWGLKMLGAAGPINAVYVLGKEGVSGWTTDAGSIAAYGRREVAVKDNNCATAGALAQRGSAVLAANKDPIVTYECYTEKGGLSVGMNVELTDSALGLTAENLLIQQVETTFLTGTKPIYKLTLGGIRLNARLVGYSVMDRIGTIETDITDIDVFIGDLQLLGWCHSLTFSATDYNTVAWTAGTIIMGDGTTTFSIDAGNTGNIAAITYIYLDVDTSLTVLQTTTSASTSVGVGKVLVAVAKPTVSGKDAEFQVMAGYGTGTYIQADNIAASTITTNEIASNTIVAGNIAAATITGAKIAATTIEAGNIAASTITGAKIAANTIEAGNIKALTITAAEIAASTITGAKIAATTIEAANIAAATITGAKIAANTIEAGNIAALTITAAELAADSVTATKVDIATLSAISANMGTLTAGEIQVGTGTVGVDFTGFRIMSTYIGGYASNVLQAGIASATGKFVCAGGNVVLDANGIQLPVYNGADYLAAQSIQFKVSTTVYSVLGAHYESDEVSDYNELIMKVLPIAGLDSNLICTASRAAGRTATAQYGVVGGVLTCFSDASGGTYMEMSPTLVTINDTANAGMTIGLTIQQDGNDDEALALKSSDVAHGYTSGAETDTYAAFRKASASAGGLLIRALRDSGDSNSDALQLQGVLAEAANTTKTTAGAPVVRVDAFTTSGNAIANMVADGNLFGIRTYIGDAYVTRFLFDAEGSAHADVEWTTFDEHDDVALLDKVQDTIMAQAFGGWVDENKAELERLGIAHFDDKPGHAMVNWTRLSMLLVGALRQTGARVSALEQRLLEG